MCYLRSPCLLQGHEDILLYFLKDLFSPLLYLGWKSSGIDFCVLLWFSKRFSYTNLIFLKVPFKIQLLVSIFTTLLKNQCHIETFRKFKRSFKFTVVLKAILQIINALYLLRIDLLSMEPNLGQLLKLLSNIKHFFLIWCQNYNAHNNLYLIFNTVIYHE